MSKSRICILAALAVALFLVSVSSRQTHGQAKKMIDVEVCVLNDKGKYVAGVMVHISPYGKPDPDMQTTNGEKCLVFKIEATTSFEIAFWHEGRILGVQRALAGFENAFVRVNYKQLSEESSDLAFLRLGEISAYTNSLRGRSSRVTPDAIKLLKGENFKNQMRKIASDLKKTDMGKIQGNILKNIPEEK